MSRVCGKQVNSWRINLGVRRARSSTIRLNSWLTRSQLRVQPSHLHAFFHIYAHSFPHPKKHDLPLIEHYFYPVSTAPTINLTKEILKKGL